MDRVNLRPYRHGRLATAIVAAVTAVAGGCTGPNPAFVGADALGRPGSGGSPDGAGGSGGGAGGTGDGAPPSGDALPADGAPSSTDASPPDAAWMDLGAPADLPAPPPDTALPADATPPPADTAPPVDLPAADIAPDAPRAPTSRFNFEASAQGWGDLRPGTRDFPTTVTRMTAPAPAWDGQWGLGIAMRSGTSTSLASTHRIIGVAQEFRSQLPANTTISYRLWLPAGDALDYIQPFVLYYKPADATGNPQWAGIDPPLFAADMGRGDWVTITHRVPSNADSRGVVEVGLEFVLRPSRSLTVYLDGVDW